MQRIEGQWKREGRTGWKSQSTVFATGNSFGEVTKKWKNEGETDGKRDRIT